MTHVRLLVDAVDNDLGHDGQEATYASDRAADPNRPDTLPRYDLLRPLRALDPPAADTCRFQSYLVARSSARGQ